MNDMIIHVGHYGSGKSELSLKYAYEWAEEGHAVTLVDLDIVNPYFRTGEHKDELEAAGIEVIRPNFAKLGLDVPSLPPEVASAFHGEGRHVIFDVGGDPTGAAALGVYRQRIINAEATIRCVINTCRPFTSDAKSIVTMVQDIERRSRLKVAELIHNTNAAYDTEADMVVRGQAIMEDAAEVLGLPITAIYAMQSVIEHLPQSFMTQYQDRIKAMEPKMRPAWLDGQ